MTGDVACTSCDEADEALARVLALADRLDRYASEQLALYRELHLSERPARAVEAGRVGGLAKNIASRIRDAVEGES